MPDPFEKLIGTPFRVDEKKFRDFLRERRIEPDALGGSIDDPLSRSAAGSKPQARYFVIHDVSYNLCDDVTSLARSVDPDASWNRASRWSNSGAAHLFITRDGKLIAPQGRTFGVPWRATKLEKQIGEQSRGLFLHVENVQLRTVGVQPGQKARTQGGKCRNDRIAENPGFSQVQYSRLALVYIAASHRARKWLVPAYHLAMDYGLDDAHDDPQNFDLNELGRKVCGHLTALGGEQCAP